MKTMHVRKRDNMSTEKETSFLAAHSEHIQEEEELHGPALYHAETDRL